MGRAVGPLCVIDGQHQRAVGDRPIDRCEGAVDGVDTRRTARKEPLRASERPTLVGVRSRYDRGNC